MLKERSEGFPAAVGAPVFAAVAFLGGLAAYALTKEKPVKEHLGDVPIQVPDVVKNQGKSTPTILLAAGASVLGVVVGLVLPRTRWEGQQIRSAMEDFGRKLETRVSSELWSKLKNRAGL
jgi:hypothetical protein